MKRVNAFKLRLYPSPVQEGALREALKLTRRVYKAARAERREAWKKAPITGEEPGYPRFKDRDRWDSFSFTHIWDNARNEWFGPDKPLEGGRIYLPKIGNVRISVHRLLEGKPTTLTIKREGSRWYAVFTYDAESRPFESTPERSGIDLCTNLNFLITSDGEFVPAPRYYRRAQAKLRRAQRVVPRPKSRSGPPGKVHQVGSRLHRKVARPHLDFHSKTARALINRFDAIPREDVNAIGLAHTRTVKGVLDAGWVQFLNRTTFLFVRTMGAIIDRSVEKMIKLTEPVLDETEEDAETRMAKVVEDSMWERR